MPWLTLNPLAMTSTVLVREIEPHDVPFPALLRRTRPRSSPSPARSLAERPVERFARDVFDELPFGIEHRIGLDAKAAAQRSFRAPAPTHYSPAAFSYRRRRRGLRAGSRMKADDRVAGSLDVAPGVEVADDEVAGGERAGGGRCDREAVRVELFELRVDRQTGHRLCFKLLEDRNVRRRIAVVVRCLVGPTPNGGLLGCVVVSGAHAGNQGHGQDDRRYSRAQGELRHRLPPRSINSKLTDIRSQK